MCYINTLFKNKHDQDRLKLNSLGILWIFFFCVKIPKKLGKLTILKPLCEDGA